MTFHSSFSQAELSAVYSDFLLKGCKAQAVCVCMYIYVYISIYMCIYMYISGVADKCSIPAI